MKCNECEFYRNNECVKGNTSLTSMEDITCLLRLIVIHLRDITLLLEDTDEDDWKDGQQK
jgi:hypothetical protein